MNYGTESRRIFLKGIDDNKFLPKEYKKELKQIIANQFLVMGSIIGTFELLVHREQSNLISKTKV